jgi:hypothetical protein
MFFKDIVKVLDSVKLTTLRKGQLIKEILLDPEFDKPCIEVKGWVELVMRERGKLVPGSKRSGFNIWTNTGREYVAQRISIAENAPSLLSFRQDMVTYVGVGTGYTLENVGVSRLVTPIPYITGQFLAALEVPPTFPLSPVKTTARYRKVFSETDITYPAGTIVNISEIGLYTGGDPSSTYAQTARDTTIGTAASQAPVAYKSLEEPISKNDALQLELAWEIRM